VFISLHNLNLNLYPFALPHRIVKLLLHATHPSWSLVYSLADRLYQSILAKTKIVVTTTNNHNRVQQLRTPSPSIASGQSIGNPTNSPTHHINNPRGLSPNPAPGSTHNRPSSTPLFPPHNTPKDPPRIPPNPPLAPSAASFSSTQKQPPQPLPLPTNPHSPHLLLLSPQPTTPPPLRALS
jgi:hypothetical protein